jgi:putative membrane protein
MEWRFIVALIGAVVVAIFAIQNATGVEVSIFLWKCTMSQALIILISAGLGAVISLFLGLFRFIKTSLKLKKAMRTIALLEQENTDLKKQIEESATVKTEVGEEENTEPVGML